MILLVEAPYSKPSHCVSKYMMFPVVEVQDFSSPRLDLSLLFIPKAHGMLCSRTQNFRTYTQ